MFGYGGAKTWHLLELEVRRAGERPVELLGGELELRFECNGAGNVVISVQACNLAPEEHLISIDGATQLTQRHLKLHPEQIKRKR